MEFYFPYFQCEGSVTAYNTRNLFLKKIIYKIVQRMENNGKIMCYKNNIPMPKIEITAI